MARLKLTREPSLTPIHKSYPFQAEAVRALRDLEYGAIFHEQGLGKTKIAIDLMLYWLEKRIIDTVLFVVKKGLVSNWVNEIRSHTHLRPPVLGANRGQNYFIFNGPARAVLTNYEAIKNEKERMKLFLKARDVAAVLDESVKIKNPYSSLTEAFFELSPLFKKRFIMTGTPVANRPYDIWAQIWFLDQGESLGNDFRKFKADLNLSNTLSDSEEIQTHFEREMVSVYHKISKFSVRETKKSCAIELPEKVFEKVEAQWEQHQLELYCQLRDEERAIVLKHGIPSVEETEYVLKRLLRMVQAASNPRLIDGGYSQVPGKLEPLIRLVENIRLRNEKCIIWSSFVENVDWLAKEFKTFGACKVHGKMTIDDRYRSISRFKEDPGSYAFIATPGAAKEGLTLTVANHVIFYDRSFSLDDYLQAQDRIHRISQNRVCHVYNLIMKDSIDEWIDLLLQAKQLAAQLTQGDISLEYYRGQISYEFGDMLRRVLNLDDERNGVQNE